MQGTHPIEIQFMNWINALNNSNYIEDFYCEQSVLFYKNESPVVGSHNIGRIYKLISRIHGKIIEQKTVHKEEITQTKDVVFELGELTFEDDVTYVYLLGWRNLNERWVREIEAISKKTSDRIDQSGLNNARLKWELLASNAGAIPLVNASYLERCHYFNRGTLHYGRESLAKVYAYMNDERYSVELSSIISHPVNDYRIFELGKWTTNGFSDIYMAIWEKGDHNEWQMYLDSNW